MKIKLLAEKASVVSVSGESGQIVLRFPALPEGVSQRALPYLGPDVRTGKKRPLDAKLFPGLAG